MSPEERARKCYEEMWAGNGTHSEDFVIGGIARAIRAAEQSVHLTAFGVGFVSGLLFFGLALAMVLFIIGSR